MENQATIKNQNNDEIHDNEIRFCWYCKKFEDHETNAGVQWSKPCKCEGIFRWIHQSCLQIWVDILQGGNSFRRVRCLICETDYIIVLPSMGFLYDVLDFVDVLAPLSYQILAGVFLAKTPYIVACTYGHFTANQVLEHHLTISEFSLFELVILPAIPFFLLFGRLIRWEDYIIRILEYYQILQTTDNNSGVNDREVRRNSIFAEIFKVENFSVLLLPSISSVVGHVFFSYVTNKFYRTLLGGLTFIAVKGVFKIYMKLNQSTKKIRCKIIDYTDENIQRYQHSTD